MENINAEIFTLRNQRKLIKKITEKLNSVLKEFDKLENQLLKAQYKHGIMIAFDEIGYSEDIYNQRIQELFEIKRNYHHLWAEAQQLYSAMQKHYSSEEGLLQDLKSKIESLTPDHIEDIKSLQKKKKSKGQYYFKDLTNTKKEIDDLRSVVRDLEGMSKYVAGDSNKAYYTKEVKEFNRITDKIASEEEKLAQFEKVKNSNMIKSTNALLRSLYSERESIIKKTQAAIKETLKSLTEKISYRQKIADKFFKIKAIRIFVQGLPWAGKFSFINALDPYSALQRKGNFTLVQAPDFISSGFKGLLVWVQNEQDPQKGKILTLPEFEDNFEEYKERVKVKIELTCATGHMEEVMFRRIGEGMKFKGLIFIYDASKPDNFEDAQKLYETTRRALSFEEQLPSIVFANKKDLLKHDPSKLIDEAHLVSIEQDPEELQTHVLNFLTKIIHSEDEIQKIMNIDLEKVNITPS